MHLSLVLKNKNRHDWFVKAATQKVRFRTSCLRAHCFCPRWWRSLFGTQPTESPDSVVCTCDTILLLRNRNSWSFSANVPTVEQWKLFLTNKEPLVKVSCGVTNVCQKGKEWMWRSNLWNTIPSRGRTQRLLTLVPIQLWPFEQLKYVGHSLQWHCCNLHCTWRSISYHFEWDEGENCTIPCLLEVGTQWNMSCSAQRKPPSEIICSMSRKFAFVSYSAQERSTTHAQLLTYAFVCSHLCF